LCVFVRRCQHNRSTKWHPVLLWIGAEQNWNLVLEPTNHMGAEMPLAVSLLPGVNAPLSASYRRHCHSRLPGGGISGGAAPRVFLALPFCWGSPALAAAAGGVVLIDRHNTGLPLTALRIPSRAAVPSIIFFGPGLDLLPLREAGQSPSPRTAPRH
jgi:hypothetical protein